MTPKFRIALAQINATVGDISGNKKKIIRYIEEAKKRNVDIVAFPELSVIGYPPEDLLLKSQFVSDSVKSLEEIMTHTQDIMAIIGYANNDDEVSNAAAIVHNRRLIKSYHKIHLPNYDVFDERRYFRVGETGYVFEINDVRFGVSVCEDIWIPDSVTEDQVRYGGAQFIFNISASPFHRNKVQERKDVLIDRSRKNGIFIFYVNLVGGQDELVFDGNSMIMDNRGELRYSGKQFEEELIIYDLDTSKLEQKSVHPTPGTRIPCDYDIKVIPVEMFEINEKVKDYNAPKLRCSMSEMEQIYQALVLGTKDYIYKNGFSKAVLGLSGGIDSALTAVIAAEAIGPHSVVGVTMPSQYSSEGSIIDSELLADGLGITLYSVPIQKAFDSYKQMLSHLFKDTDEDITEENIQARIRGNVIMALSNKFGWLPLTTGNKSELSVGYCTLYGDMSGGFAVIKDVPKTLVYQLSLHINDKYKREIIPLNTINKPPSAELKPDQKDSDSLPSYDELDPILHLYIEQDYDIKRIIESGHNEALVKRIVRMVDRSEYKRRQAPPGVRISPKAFGKDRRMPITNHYH